MEQDHQQQQQQQGWNNEMGQGYEQVGSEGGYQGMSGTETGQYGQYAGGEAAKEQGASLGVYTPDSSTNSVHSLHGYPESHENYTVQPGETDMTDQTSYSQELSQGALDTSYNPVPDTATEPVHNTSVMESPSSIGSVEIAQQYSDQSCSQNVHPRPVHTVSNSPSHPATSNQSPHNSINQSPSAGIHNMTSHSPPHQSPTGSGYATPAPPPGRQPSSSSKSPGRGSRSGLSSSQQTQQLVRQQLSHQYQYDQY